MSDQKPGPLVIIVAGVLVLVIASFGINKLYENVLAAYQKLGKIEQMVEEFETRKAMVEKQLEKLERQFKDINKSSNQNLVDVLQALVNNPTTTILLDNLQKLQTNAGIKICSYSVPLGAANGFTDGTVAPSSWTPKHCLEYNKKATVTVIKFRNI